MADCAEDFGVIEETLGEALALHQAGRLAEAERHYREILAACGDHAEVSYYLGLLCQADGRGDEARDHLEVACRLEPQQASFHLALGTLRQQLGDFHAAIDAYRITVSAAPDSGRAWYNLGVACFMTGQLTEAIAAYEQAVACDADDVDALFNLAIAYDKAGRSEAAIGAYGRAMELAPADPDIPYNLALLHKRAHTFDVAQQYLEQVIGLHAGYAPAYGHLATIYNRQDQRQLAIRCYERMLELGHDPEAARHMLAALKGKQCDTASVGYVRKLFDGYADNFEQELVERLGYRAPMLLRQLVGALFPAAWRLGRVLDLGCGTGLAGEAFRDLAVTLTGVDLSPRMLAIAGGKGIYDALEVSEVVDFCRRQAARFDCIVAADVLVYLGDLAPLFTAVNGCLAPGGLFAFSIERCEAGRYMLRPTGRYAHTTEYIEEMAAAHGLRIERCEETQLRQEKGEWLVGTLFVLAAAD